MNLRSAQKMPRCWRAAGGALALVLAGSVQALDLAQAPLMLQGSVKPNVLVILDNSQSMDGTMAGRLIAGNDASTRGNMARAILRDTITRYRDTFQWGLMSFEMASAPQLLNTYAYYFGTDAQVVYTNDCVGGISATNGGLRCVANPEPGNGFGFLTFAVSGDDSAINDVLYVNGDFGGQLYGVGADDTNDPNDYRVYPNHANAAGDQFDTPWFTAPWGWNSLWTFTPTDAGYLPSSPPQRRMFWLRRAWGYGLAAGGSNITGNGALVRGAVADSTSHYNALMASLAVETDNVATTELKNAAVFTPLAGTLRSAYSYFSNTLSGASTPIAHACQRNFVLLTTDGNPTGKIDGSMYSLADQFTAYNAVTGQWTYSTAANDVFTEVQRLRSVLLASPAAAAGAYDVQTYVVGLGDSVANAASIAMLDRIATLGGSQRAYLASDAASLATAFNSISADIVARVGSAASVALNSGSASSDTEVYQARFNSGDWSGQLRAYRLQSDGSLADTARWDAAQRLNVQNWDTGRQILTYRASAALGARGIAFRWPANPAAPSVTELDAAWMAALNTDMVGASDGYGSQRLNHLRGDRSREVSQCPSCSVPTFRNRPSTVLGDIVNAAPVHSANSARNLRDTIEAVSYRGFRAQQAGRTALVFAGANDGMLHAFNAGTGDEVFAYVPALVRDRLSALTHPSYVHRYSVDGPPALSDAFYGGAWHTVLVAGLGGGGKGIYALDVTDPGKMKENHAADVVRWELDSSDADMGHVFQAPIVAKMRNGRWMAIFGNGYGSANGQAILMLADVQTGAVTRVSTRSGSTVAPNGLSGVAVVSRANNGVADLVYAGDLAGNLWKFDLSATNPAQWSVAFGTAAAPAPLFSAGSAQPITSRPDVTPHPKGGYQVVFGTGRYLTLTDPASVAVQALYGIRDSGTTVNADQLVTQSVLGTANGTDGRTYRVSSFVVGTPTDTSYAGDGILGLDAFYADKRGWMLTLPITGERIVQQASVRNGKVIVSTLIPDTQPCSYGGDGWVMEVDVVTGNRPTKPWLDTNGDNALGSADQLAYRGASAFASGVRVGALPSAPAFLKTPTRTLEDKLVSTSAGTVVRVRESGGGPSSGRVGWEQLR